ncbi:MAG: adenylate/guanylate cyclase domain-containing protein [Nitrososphaeraceae archaeon]
MQIPALIELTEREEIPRSLILLTGNTNVGKSLYCRQLLVDRLNDGSECVYVNCASTEEQLQEWLDGIGVARTAGLHFINPYLRKQSGRGDSSAELSNVLTEIKHAMSKPGQSALADEGPQKESGDGHGLQDTAKKGLTLIVDSLNHLIALFGKAAVEAFVTDIYFTSKMQQISGICALTTPSLSKDELERLNQSIDALLEMAFKDDMDLRLRHMKMVMIRGMTLTPKWVDFELEEHGTIKFLKKETEFTCYVCKSVIHENPVSYSGLYFHVNHLEVYKRLVGIYGLNLSELGFSSEVMDANFFFIDIVGLSDPSFSVSSQRQKIEVLNNLIMSCNAYNGEEKKIILPTGDGMVIGFVLNPENPLKLGIQLHQKLRSYNRGKGDRDKLKVRIGLSAGPVFSVNDIQNNQNFWGPGIIMARRIMDIGGEGHILLSEPLAKALLSLKDEYSPIINPIGEYSIKHGQTLTLYSAYSNDFGNPKSPERR